MSSEPRALPWLVRFCDNFLQERSIKWVLALGMFILLGSSVLLVTTQWHSYTPLWKYLVFLGYTTALAGTGQWTYHRLGLRRTGTALQGLTVLLLPALFLVLGWVIFGPAAPVLPVTLLLGGVTLALSVTAASRIFHHFLRGAQPTFQVCYLLLSVAGALLPALDASGAATVALGLWAVFAVGTIKVSRHVFWLTEEQRAPRIFGFFPIALLGGQFLTLFLLHAAPHLGADWIGVGCVLLAIPVLGTADAVAHVFQQRTGDLVRPLPWSVLTPLGVGLMLCAAGICLAGISLVPPSRPHALVFATAGSAALFGVVARRTGKAAFVWAMLVCATLAYQFTPAFFMDLVIALRDHGARAIREERLPLAFYGLTYLPLLLALMTAARLTEAAGNAVFARPLRRYCTGLSGLLLVLALSHPKAIFPVGLVLTLLFAAQVVLFRNQWLAVASALAWALSAFGLADFLSTVLQMPLPADFRLCSLTGAAALLLLAGRWLDARLAQLGTPVPEHEGDGIDAVGRQICQVMSLALTGGLTASWIVRFVDLAPAGAWVVGLLPALLLLTHAVCWPAVRVPTLVLLNWQAFALLASLLGGSLVNLQPLPLPLACMAAASALGWQRVAARSAFFWAPVALTQLALMRVFAAAGLACSLVLPGLDALDVGLAAITFLLLILAELHSAYRRGDEIRAWLGLAVALAALAYFAYLRVFDLQRGLGMFLVLGAGLLLWLGKEAAARQPRGSVFVRPLGITGFVMPLVVVGLGVFRHLELARQDWLGLNSLALLLAAAFYFWRSLETRRKELVLLAGLILNVALTLLWRELDWSDPQFFMIPCGISVLALVQLCKEEIPGRWHDPLRYLGALVILVSPTFHIVGGSWVHLFSLMVAAVGVVLVAIGLRVRALMYTGTAFLLADLVAMLVRGSIDNANVLWLAGLTLGAAVLALGAACERHREVLRERMRALAVALQGWE
jgi:hypothetical protein